MCHFITAVLPADADLPRLRTIAREHALNLEEIHNAHVRGQLRDDERYYLTTAGICDCGTVLGSAVTSEQRSHAKGPTERDVSALRHRGWGESKIERWRSQHSGNTTRDTRVQQQHSRGRALEADDWKRFLEEVLASNRAVYIGILLHWYRRSVDAERIQIQQRRSVAQPEITAELLMRLPEDELYVFSRSAKVA